MTRIYELKPKNPDTDYISQSCLYMNPLSSTFSNGDSGYRYLIGENSFTIINNEPAMSCHFLASQLGLAAFKRRRVAGTVSARF